jgi:hypothetical protein
MKRLIPIKQRFIVPTSLIFLFIFSSLVLAALETSKDESQELSKYQKPIYGPTSELAPLDQYKSTFKENPFSIAQKIDGMITDLSGNISAMTSHPSITGEGMPVDMMDQADSLANEARAAYPKIHSMYSEIHSMQDQLEGNTNQLKENLKEKIITSSNATEFNASTTGMSTRVGAMRQSLSVMKRQIAADQRIVEGMPGILDQMASYGSEVTQYYDKLAQHIKEVSSRFESMDKDLKAQGLEASEDANQVRQYLSSLQQYVKGRKPFTSKELDYIKDVKKYLAKTNDYLKQTISNIEKTDKNLSDIQLFFINSKARAGQEDEGSPVVSPEEMKGDACAGVKANEGGMVKQGKDKPLMTKDSCQKSCHTVCRQKAKNSAGDGCFECPSGSPDTCYDVGMLPADVSWCKPGGVCYDDPEMYCQPMGAMGPNKMPLNCTTCKQRPDECWQKVGNDTTNLTHCEQTCAGECVYVGKYKEQEWDGKPEFMHCYKCKMPPGPPTCEDLGWGSTTQEMCMKDCPDGECKERKITIGPDGKPFFDDKKAGPNGGQQGGQNQGQDGQNGPVDNGPVGGDKPLEGGDNQTGSGGVAGGNSQDNGKKPNPPTDTPQGGAGASTIAGGGKATDSGNQPGGTTNTSNPDNKGSVDQPTKPNSTEVKDPGAPSTSEKPKSPDQPQDNPPSNFEIDFYTKWLNETKERIKKYEGIANDPNEFQGVKDMANNDLVGMTKEKEYLEKRLKEEQDKERERLKKEADEKKMVDDYYKNRPKTVSYAEEAERRGKEWKIKELKKATDELQTKIREAKEAITGRREHIEKINKEIDLLKKENEYLKQAKTEERIDSDFAERKIKENEDRIKELTEIRNTLTKKLNETVRKYNEEINKLKSNYQKAYWQYNENARRKAEVERMNEYMEKYDELRRSKQAKEIRDKVFDDFKNSLQGELTRAKEAGDTSKADDLQRQIDNLTRGKQQWDDQMDKRIENIQNDLYETGQRNFNEGAGPFSVENLGEKYDQYNKYADQNIADIQKALSEGKITKTQADEAIKTINDTKSQLASQKDYYKNGSPFSKEDIDRITQSAMKVANGSMGQDADKNFAQLFGESLVEEMVHNMNPLVVIKKSWAFGTGFVEGVATGVKDVANIGYQAVKTVAQATAVDLGFENGGIFGTDNLDALAGLGSTISSNFNFDGAISGLMTVGKALDDQLIELGKGDIDKKTANFGGKIAGNIVGNELGGMAAGEVLGAAYDATKTLVKGGEEVATATKAIDEATEALNAGEKATSLEKPPKVETTPVETHGPPEVKTTEAPKGEVPEEVKAPKGPEGEGTQPRGPPEGEKPPKAGEYGSQEALPNKTGTTEVKPLDDATLDKLEKEKGFRRDHAERMNEFAQEKGVYLIVRDGNPDSVKFMSNDEMMSKPMSSKAKTAQAGPDKGLVVDPTHPKQAQYWDEAIADAEKAGNKAEVERLKYKREKALDTWEHYGDEMLKNGYQVNPDTGVIEYVEKLPDGTTKTWKGVHGDYDLHGVYKANPDGTIEHVSYGTGEAKGADGRDVLGGDLRKQLNDKLTAGGKDMVNHGGQDDWVTSFQKAPDPPAVVFPPDGSGPVYLKDAQAMKDYYEKVMKVEFPYDMTPKK